MKRLMMPAAVALLVAGCGGGGSSQPAGPDVPSLGTASLAGLSAGTMPQIFTCDGGGQRPVVGWTPMPPATRSIAVLITDRDAGGGRFVHVAIWGIQPTAVGLPINPLPTGAVSGANSAGGRGWTPVCPPKGAGPHHYDVAVYALRAPLTLASGAAPPAIFAALKAEAFGVQRATLTYQRT